ncbi:zinc-finger domain-containing protein [Bacillus mycoides]|uniref:zinc-finger domain-containing protein n=1 Tax=Bacillus mycoides TaxID=1405 RepID=UPI002E1DE339|nr:zinc-finger domain-containing protein [Bacillus mycoides]
MNKKEAIMEVVKLLDNHCHGCENRYSHDLSYCWKKCEIGKRLNTLGGFLGGKVVGKQQKQRTPEQWDDICKTTVKLKENGMTYIKIAKKFNVSVGHLRLQLKRRNKTK